MESFLTIPECEAVLDYIDDCIRSGVFRNDYVLLLENTIIKELRTKYTYVRPTQTLIDFVRGITDPKQEGLFFKEFLGEKGSDMFESLKNRIRL